MLLKAVFDRFVRKSPISVMARATLEHALAPKDVDRIFGQNAEMGYERTLLFSSLVDLMGMVVCKIRPSVNAAFQAVEDSLPVSLTSVYNKLNGLEAQVSSALVRHTYDRLRPVVEAMGGERAAWLDGYRVKVLDGNHLAATERRLDVLRGSLAGPLPGHALVILDPALGLMTRMLPSEDAYASERSLTDEILNDVEEGDCYLADRNFCTERIVFGIAKKRGRLIMRQHAKLNCRLIGTPVAKGRTEDGLVSEQSIETVNDDGETMRLRRVVIRLDTPTRKGETEIALVTNLPASEVDAKAVTRLYRRRWTIETAFGEMARMLEGELSAMGYPRAALFGFAVALVSYNILATVKAALRATFGEETIERDVSGYFIADEVQASHHGLDIVFEPEFWRPFHRMTSKTLAKKLLSWAPHVRLSALKRHPRGKKKPTTPKRRYAGETHVSTARLLSRDPYPERP